MRHVLKTKMPVAILLLALALASPVWAQMTDGTMKSMEGMMPMGGMMSGEAPVIPPVAGYSEGQDILFLHTEASDPKIAKLLTDMMGSPVIVVPALANVPKEILARVYVFTNGPKAAGAMGPLGFQPDVFESPPGSPGYTPLRTVVLVTWKNLAAAGVLKSGAEVEERLQNGDLAMEQPGVIVNMPMLTWPGGQR